MKREQKIGASSESTAFEPCGNGLSRRSLLVAGAAAAGVAWVPAALAAPRPTKFRRVPTQYIAALSDPKASSGDNAQQWGLWRQDPGPRGVQLDEYERLKAAGGVAPARWRFDNKDWWLEEHGLIMEQPEFPLPAGQYVVTGARAVTTVLTVQPMAADGTQRWQLDDNASVYDVTHLRCRSARYTPANGAAACSPADAKQSDFPVTPGAAMPPVPHCNKQDYAVLIVLAVGTENS